jgi:hypothetical protein
VLCGVVQCCGGTGCQGGGTHTTTRGFSLSLKHTCVVHTQPSAGTMPKPRERVRIVTCDCFDCREPGDGGPELSAEQLSAATAVARQDPPPKALVLLLTGVVLPGDGSAGGGSAGDGEAAGAPFGRWPSDSATAGPRTLRHPRMHSMHCTQSAHATGSLTRADGQLLRA